MKTALFHNFTNQEFTGYWDGKGKSFAPDESVYMPDYLARHFAKHLVNRELLRTDSGGSLIHKDGDKMTSPKFPEQVPIFMELFNKAYTPDSEEDLGEQKDNLDVQIATANKNRQKRLKKQQEKSKQIEDPPVLSKKKKSKIEKQDPKKPQIVLPPDFDEEGE